MAAASALLFAGKSVATPVISFLINQAFSYLKKWRNADGMEVLEARLSARMVEIQAVFDAVDRQQVKEQSAALDKWLWRLRSAVEEAEDAVDEVEYRELEDDARAWDLQDKVRTGIPMTRFVNRIAGFMPKRSTLKRLREALKKLDEVAEGVGTFLQLANRFDPPHCRHQDQSDVTRRDRETASTVIAGKIIGRDREKEQIVGWLMEAEQIKEEPEIACANGVPIFSVVGVGGMGKTTLAQLVCNDPDVVKNFDFVVWVWVSNSFDAATVIRNVLESIDKEKPTVGALDTLQKILMQKLSSKKFLLVLDDVWEDGKSEEWENLVTPLQTGQKGSKILLTTRMQSVADMAAGVIGCKAEVLKLNGLDEGANLALFKRHAFASIAPERCADFLLTSEQIVEKMRGCPLMTKVVGGHLRDNMTRQYWNWFLHEEMHHFTGGTDDVAMALRLSYHHLPAHLQLCFRYCSIFPQGYEFKKEELVKMWMCSGMIMQATGSTRRLEDVGEDYLALLTRKSFFDLLSEEHYVMHELLHDLARIASFGECLRIDGVGHINILSTVRHLWVAKLSTLSTQVLKKISELKNLRTVTIEGFIGEVNRDVLAAIREAVKSFKGLHVLSLYGLEEFYFPIDVASMKHLRYISLPRGQKVYGLCKLYHLQVLIARGTVKIEPKQLRNLAYLRYVACDTNEFGCFPVGRLTSLQELQNFKVQPRKGYEICSLRDLNNLHKLEVLGLENVGSHEEAKKAKLHEKEHLRSLLLQWSGGKCVPKHEDDVVLDQLKPHVNLQELKISGHNGVRPPTWMITFQFANLSSLELQGCNWEYLPPLGELQLLRHVSLKNLPELKHIGQFYDVSRSGHHDLCLPVGLRSLTARRCAKFQELAVLPPNLTELEIDNVGWTTFPRVETQTESCQLISIQISNCENIISAEESLSMEQCGDLELALLGSLHGLDNLTTLKLYNCSSVTSLPSAEVFGSLKSLREMDIEECENLQSLGGLGALPSSLTRLSISRCSKLTADAAPSLPAYASDGNEGEGNLTVVKSERWLRVTDDNLSYVTSLKNDLMVTLGLANMLQRQMSNFGYALSKLCRMIRWDIIKALASILSKKDGEGDLVPGCSFQVSELEIDDPSLLLVKPLRSLCQTRKLYLEDASGVKSLLPAKRWLRQNRRSLQSLCISRAESLELLASSIRDLCCLESLVLFDAARLGSLPDLPSSLFCLLIDGCNSELEAQCRGGSERDKIANIPCAFIGDDRYELGKLTYRMTDIN